MKSHRVVRGTGSKLRDELLLDLLHDTSRLQRATGFFASSSFSIAPKEWRDFFSQGGEVEIVCSPILQRGDVEAIIEGLTERKNWRGKPAPTPKSTAGFGRSLLTWAIANRKLYIKIASIFNSGRGIYHEKFGVGWQSDVPKVVFIGSVNESGPGYADNFELAQIIDSSESHAEVNDYVERFARLWANDTVGLEVLPFHSALAEGKIEVRTGEMTSPVLKDSELSGSTEVLTDPSLVEVLQAPPELKLRDYQENAIDAWFAAGGQGIYSMATGTGKTITSLATALRLYDEVGGPLILIVVAPYLVLVDQWITTMNWFGLSPVRCAGGRGEWEDDAHLTLRLANRGKREVASFVVTNTSFALPPFQRLLEKLGTRTLLIVDEVHNFGAPNLQRSLPDKIALRLGLSATPVRHRDEEGTEALLNYFGNPVINFGMEDAMSVEPPALVPYRYMPVTVELTDDEYEEYLDLTGRIGKALAGASNLSKLPEPAKKLLIRRARLVGAAENKLQELERVIEPYRDVSHTLIYCGDGSVSADEGTDQESEYFTRQIEAVVKLLGSKLGMQVASYTSYTSMEDREILLREFQAGRLQALVAIRCLDEGLDVPNVRRAFILASSTNPRQFIQRRGRVLRKAPGKTKAEIFDFFTVPPVGADDPTTRETQRNLVRKEMKRAVEFMGLATNKTEARHQLWAILTRLNLLDTLIEKGEGND